MVIALMAIIPQSSLSGPLAPKYNVTEDTREIHSSPESPKKNTPNYIPLGVFVMISLLAIPFTLSQLKNQQDIRQRASGPYPTQIIPSPTPFPSPTPILFPTATPRVK